jgi:hypothetical protein
MTAVATAVMRVVCAWCGRTIREGDDPMSKVVSHGICASCAAVTFPERAERSA